MGRINCSDDMLTEKTVADKEIYSGRVLRLSSGIFLLLKAGIRHVSLSFITAAPAFFLLIGLELLLCKAVQISSGERFFLKHRPARLKPGGSFDCVSRDCRRDGVSGP